MQTHNVKRTFVNRAAFVNVGSKQPFAGERFKFRFQVVAFALYYMVEISGFTVP